MANFYWVAGTGNWSDATDHWATTSGGTPGSGNLPTAADNAYFDQNSGTGTVTVDVGSYVCLNLDFTQGAGYTGTFAGLGTLTVSGSYTLSPGMTYTYTGTLNFNSTSTGNLITSNGIAITSPLQFNGVGGSWLLNGDLVINSNSSFSVALINGTFDLNYYNYTGSKQLINSPGSNVRQILFRSAVVTKTGVGNFFGLGLTNLDFDFGTSLVKFVATGVSGTVSLGTGGLTYYDFQDASTGTYTLSIPGDNTFNNFICRIGATYDFASGSTQTFADFIANGVYGSQIVIQTTTAGSATLVKSGGGRIYDNFVNISDMNGSPNFTWFMGANSTNGGSNTQIYFDVVGPFPTYISS